MVRTTSPSHFHEYARTATVQSMYVPGHSNYPNVIHFHMKLCITLEIKELYNPFHKTNVVPRYVKRHHRFEDSFLALSTQEHIC